MPVKFSTRLMYLVGVALLSTCIFAVTDHVNGDHARNIDVFTIFLGTCFFVAFASIGELRRLGKRRISELLAVALVITTTSKLMVAPSPVWANWAIIALAAVSVLAAWWHGRPA
jgi:hypothetical protein